MVLTDHQASLKVVKRAWEIAKIPPTFNHCSIFQRSRYTPSTAIYGPGSLSDDLDHYPAKAEIIGALLLLKPRTLHVPPHLSTIVSPNLRTVRCHLSAGIGPREWLPYRPNHVSVTTYKLHTLELCISLSTSSRDSSDTIAYLHEGLQPLASSRGILVSSFIEDSTLIRL